jgi:hypothetical protein
VASPGYLRLYDPSGNLLDQLTTPGSGAGQLSSTPTGGASDADGNIYVAERVNNRVKKFDPAGNSLAVFGSSGSGDGQLQSPRDVAVDSAGNVYVADTENDRVQKFDAAGSFLLTWGGAGTGNGQFNHPFGIAVDRQGHVFVSDGDNHRIQEFDGQGNFVSKWGAHGDGPGELFWPEGLAVDSGGAVVVADSGNHRIARFCCPGAGTPAGAGGEPAPAAGTPAADTSAARIRLSGHRVQRARRVRRRGVALRITTDEPAKVSIRARLSSRDAHRIGLRSAQIGRASLDLWCGRHARAPPRTQRTRPAGTAPARHAQAAHPRALRRHRPGGQSLQRLIRRHRQALSRRTGKRSREQQNSRKLTPGAGAAPKTREFRCRVLASASQVERQTTEMDEGQAWCGRDRTRPHSGCQAAVWSPSSM